MAGALHVFAGPEAEIESNGDQVGNVVGSGVRGASWCSDNGVHDSQGGGLLSLDGEIIDTAGLELPCEALFYANLRGRQLISLSLFFST